MALARVAPQTLTLDMATLFAEADGSPEAGLMRSLQQRKSAMATEQQRFATWCDRADRMYYAEDFTEGGADHWAMHPSARTPGKAHVSVNTHAVYVDIPAALQSVPPVDNILATQNNADDRARASSIERLYGAWKQYDEFELKVAKACTVKALYGRTAGKVYWDGDKDYPCIEIIDQPRNLYLGWGSTDYHALDWAGYVYRLSPTEVLEEYGLVCTGREYDNKVFPTVVRPIADTSQTPSRNWLSFGPAMVECWDYWYRLPKNVNRPPQLGKSVAMETWNAVFVGNVLVKNAKHPEYKGKMPYVPLFNSYIPGVPDGRPELYDMEQLLREKDERITAGAQMIQSTVAGQFWQLTGPEAPDKVPPNAKPKLNEVAAPGAGNRIEALTPFIPQFQLESYLARLDREMSTVSGLNDLLLGLAPASVLSSSKAINALVANYEAHIGMKRQLLYDWRRKVVRLVTDVWSYKNTTIRDLLADGYFLDVKDPSLTPRDDLETATMALNLLNGKVWSAKRAMDATGVEDPEQEEDVIREEQTDAALNPQAVAMMAQLMQTLAALQQPPPPAASDIAAQQFNSLQNNYRQASATPTGTEGSQGLGAQGMTPPEELPPPPGGGLPPGSPPDMSGTAGMQLPPAEQPAQLQQMLMGGQLKSRIITKRNVPGG